MYFQIELGVHVSRLDGLDADVCFLGGVFLVNARVFRDLDNATTDACFRAMAMTICTLRPNVQFWANQQSLHDVKKY